MSDEPQKTAGDGEAEIPTRDEIATLPRWAQAAFAARCARRVQALFLKHWPDAPPEHVEGVDRAIALAETLCGSPSSASEDAFSARAAAKAAFSARAAAKAAFAAANAADAAAANAADAFSANAAAANAADAADAADAFSAFAAARAAVVRAMRSDFALLAALAKSENWTDETAVPVDLLGPMWAEGEPDGWPESNDPGEPLRLKIEIAVPSGMDEAESDAFNRRVATFFAKMSAAHVAMDGNGLRLIEDASCEEVEIFDELPVDTECVGAGGAGDV